MSMIRETNIGCGIQKPPSLALSRFATKRVYDGGGGGDDGVHHVSSAHCTLRSLVARLSCVRTLIG